MKKQETATPARQIPFCVPSVGEEEIAEVVDTLRSGWLTTGPKVKQFEEELARYTGARHAVAVNSCTAALHLALVTLGIGEGDEVITSPLTFCSTVNTIVHTGALPVFADIRPDTLNIDPEAIEAAITPRTKALVVVDYAGQPVNHTAIQAIANKHDLPVIEDAAHAIGARFKDQPVGSISTVTCFSFYAIKNMTTGEGGAFLTNDDELAARARVYSLHGMSKDAWKRYTAAGSWYYEVTFPGFKYNMMDMQAALGLHQLRKLDGFIAAREEHARRYDRHFAGSDLVETPFVCRCAHHARHLYPLQLNLEQLDIDRAGFIEQMKERGVGCTVNFIPVHLHPYYEETFGFERGMFPQVERAYDRLVSLPLHPGLSEDDIDYIAGQAREILEAARRSQGVAA